MKNPRRDLKSEPDGLGSTINYGLIEGLEGFGDSPAIVDGDDPDTVYYNDCVAWAEYAFPRRSA